ncbi:hypothetical protein AB5I41_07770 [Sphingomonas sp. MMS24-JH45]
MTAAGVTFDGVQFGRGQAGRLHVRQRPDRAGEQPRRHQQPLRRQRRRGAPDHAGDGARHRPQQVRRLWHRRHVGGGSTGAIHDNLFQGAAACTTGLGNGVNSETSGVTINGNTFTGLDAGAPPFPLGLPG